MGSYYRITVSFTYLVFILFSFFYVFLHHRNKNCQTMDKKIIPITDSPIAKYWDYNRNIVDPKTIASKSGKKFWWICPECGESHEKVAINQHKSPLCRKCGQKKAIENGYKKRIARSHSIADDPILSKYWDYENNIDNPANITYKSNKIFRWICSECSKSFERSAINENKSTICQKCGIKKGTSNAYVTRVKKTHSIADDSILSKYWDYDKNVEDPRQLAYKCNRKFHWICPNCGNSFERAASHMIDGQLCNECSIKKRTQTRHEVYMQTAKSIADDPVLSKYWDYDHNPEDPKTIPFRSNGYFYWICPKCSTSYKRNASYQYVSSHLCNDCADKARLAAHAATRMERSEKVADRPNLLSQWDYAKNNISPDMVLAHSITKYWWKCPKCGKPEYNSPDRKYEANLCWDCAKIERGKSKRKGDVRRKGSFGNQHPLLAKEWHPTLNGDVTPYDITSGCGEYFYWRCKYGHIFHTSPSERVTRHAGCPICRKWLRTSFTEQAIAFYLSKIMNVVSNYKIGNSELDVYLPDFNAAIEYDGMWWHSFRNKKRVDSKKDKYCLQHGIQLIRVKEADRVDKVENKVIFAKRRNTDYRWVINQIANILGVLPPSEIDIEHDTPEILARVNPVQRENSIQYKRSDLLPYWDNDANNPITPDVVAQKSHFLFSWKCPKCGHKWIDSPMNVTQRKNICPKCRESILKDQGKDSFGRFLKRK